ncbi:MAG: DUF502 domain-containing protein [Nitrospiraceae bacterium]|nr:DUF502 domain-containing protein [Nitrospiraceae bacterium]
MRRRLLSGLLVVVPVGITFFTLHFLYKVTAGFLAPVVEKYLGHIPDYAISPVAVILFLAALYCIGLVASVLVGRRVIALGETIIHRIPFVKTIYGGSKQVAETLLAQERFAGFKSVVLVQYPHPGMRALGFMTGTIATSEGDEYCKVFIPTTPNPTSGYLEFVPPEHVQRCHLSVEDAAKLLMSGGILAPESLTLSSLDAPLPDLDTDSDDADPLLDGD